METYTLRVEPFSFLFTRKLREMLHDTTEIVDEETAIQNLLFFQEQKRRAIRGQDPFMTRYYLHALQANHYPHHPLRPTFKRAQRLIYARDEALSILVFNACLLELQQKALEQKVPSSYLLTMDMKEFEEIDTMERPEEYDTRDRLLLDQYGIGIWERK